MIGESYITEAPSRIIKLDNAWKEKKENICNIAPEVTDAKKASP
jgi:hypothetical protein